MTPAYSSRGDLGTISKVLVIGERPRSPITGRDLMSLLVWCATAQSRGESQWSGAQITFHATWADWADWAGCTGWISYRVPFLQGSALFFFILHLTLAIAFLDPERVHHLDKINEYVHAYFWPCERTVSRFFSASDRVLISSHHSLPSYSGGSH